MPQASADPTTPSTHPSRSTPIRFAQMPMGRWRIVWLGDIAYQEPARTQPSITVVLESVGGQGFARVTETSVPIAQLFALRLGSVWQDKVLTDELDAERTSLRVNFKTWKASTRPAGASVPDGSSESFLLPFETHPFHRDHTKSSCLTVEADRRVVIIPAIELIRFYFGSSGSLLRKLFSANFEPGMLVEHFSIDERRKASVILADDVAAASAQDVARIVLNEHAAAAARLISRSLVAGRAGEREDVKVYVKAALPFAGDANLTIEGVEIPVNGGPPRFLAHELVQCRARFPFSALEYVASSQRRSSSPLRESEIQTEGSTGSPRRVASRRAAGRIESREPRATSTRQIRADSRGRFPDLESKAVWRSAIEVPERVDVRALSEAPYDSTGRGTPSDEGKRVELTSGEGSLGKPALLKSPCERWMPYFQFLAMLAEQEWVEELAFVRLDPEQEVDHYGPMFSRLADGTVVLAEPSLEVQRLAGDVARWASLVNVRVGRLISSIVSISPASGEFTNVARIRRGYAIEQVSTWQAVLDATDDGAKELGWAMVHLNNALPWLESATAVEALRTALSE